MFGDEVLIVFSTNEARFITNFDTFQEFLENLVETKNLYTYQHNGFHFTVNNLAELQDAEESLIKMHQKEVDSG